MTEAELQGQVIDTAHLFGWLVAHFRPARTERGWRTAVQADGAGFVDLTLAHEGARRLIFAELKSEKGRISPAQQRWLVALHASGAEVYVWRPSDAELIERRLRV